MSGQPDWPSYPAELPALSNVASEHLVQVRLTALEAAIVKGVDGAPRPEDERSALLDAARTALDRLADPLAACAPETLSITGSLPEGTILAHTFALRDCLASGGVAEVYQARHRDLQTDYAIKIPKAERALDPLITALFIEEGRALMTLRHEAIVIAHMLMRHGDGRPFLVLDLLRGPTLAQRFAEGPMQGDELVRLAHRLAGALQAVHAAGLVHGDVSPENVILAGHAAGATLIDFGVVQALSETSPAIAFAGKYSIAAPEQLEGAPITPAFDLYAFGLLLLGAAQGHRFAGGHDCDSARAVRAAMPQVTIEGPLGDLVRRLLDPEPARRPTAAAILARLDGEEPTVLSRVLSGLGLGPGRGAAATHRGE